jgi:hypothetical protein
VLAGSGETALNVYPTLAGMYVSASWDCQFFGYLCTQERGPVFYAPIEDNFTINYDASSNNATTEFSFFNEDCSTLCQEPLMSIDESICSACENGVPMHLDLICSDCWSSSELLITDVNLDFEFQEVTKLSCNIDLDTFIQTQFDLNAFGSYNISQQLTLVPRMPIQGIPSFSIFGVTIALGLYSEVLGIVNFDVETTGNIVITTPFHLITSVSVDYDSNSFDISANLTKGNTSLDFQLSGSAYVSLAVYPNIQFDIATILDLVIGPRPTIEANIYFQVPPYAGQVGEPSWIYSLYYFGSCEEPHYLRYDIQETTLIVATASILWMKKTKTFTIEVIPLVSGCLLPSVSVDQTFSLATDIVLATLGLSAQQLVYMLDQDISSFLGIPANEVVVNVFSIDRAMQINITLLTGNQKQEKFLQESLEDPQSDLFSGNGTSLLLGHILAVPSSSNSSSASPYLSESPSVSPSPSPSPSPFSGAKNISVPLENSSGSPAGVLRPLFTPLGLLKLFFILCY